ncbi:hypothetical protein BDA96_05G237200 [Sorghum bicolor]|uniref:Knottin scorpion toxin-like domain-containing protein n=2 Tax=Sorghum bicolor TaxID=4558 RepID=A0A921UGU6_SORBI|nr:hypothetical protein BDA96_05G237200 [Sorghum bicolor]KXG29163.1 hypothetical protein SORBI_3005G221300 [Sorghum bicolor]
MALDHTRSSCTVHSTTMLVALLLVVSSLLSSTSAEWGREECNVVDYDCMKKWYLCHESCRAKAASMGSWNFRPRCKDHLILQPMECCCTVLNPRPPNYI